ncbi:hypothetical protein ACH4UY_15380 [Streptomyces longwoodensis]|uniref:hypothetical protein n=1 Tax=Streptomyces longwoodensis TaxID=68231 RepID=UPI00378B3F29
MTAETVEAEMEAANQEGDPAADALVSDLIDNREVDGVNGLFRTIGTLKPRMPMDELSNLPERLAQFLHDASEQRPAGARPTSRPRKPSSLTATAWPPCCRAPSA